MKRGLVVGLIATITLSSMFLGCFSDPQATAPRSTGQVTTEERAATAPETLYEDDFSSARSGWSRKSTESDEMYYEGGEYYIEVKKPDWAAWAWNWERITDFTLEVDARLVSGPNESACGLAFRIVEEGEGLYRFLISADGYYAIDAWFGNEWMTDLRSWTKSTSIKEGNSTNHLKVVCQGSQIEVYANGHHLATVEDILGFAQGYVGMTVDAIEPNTCFAFDNIRVYSAPTQAPPPEVTPPDEEAPPEVTPPEEESTMPILTDGTHRWCLKETTFGEQEIERGSGYSGQVYEAIEGHVFLQAEFENLSEVDLIDAWDLETTGGEMPDLMEIYLIKGIGNVYVTDSQGNVYPAVILGASDIIFSVPRDGHDFTLYFLDCAPIELGY